MSWSRATAAFAVLVAVSGVPGAQARSSQSQDGPKQASIYESKLLWATVNVCDTVDHPDTIGIRASMPGSGIAKERMFIRFQLQYYRTSDNRWHNIGASGDSGFISVGSAKFKARQTGRNFTVQPPSSGSFILRGAVTYEWRRGGEVVRRARKRTRSGHPNTRGADPATFSAATCEIRK